MYVYRDTYTDSLNMPFRGYSQLPRARSCEGNNSPGLDSLPEPSLAGDGGGGEG